jgi:hypothetical protein
MKREMHRSCPQGIVVDCLTSSSKDKPGTYIQLCSASPIRNLQNCHSRDDSAIHPELLRVNWLVLFKCMWTMHISYNITRSSKYILQSSQLCDGISVECQIMSSSSGNWWYPTCVWLATCCLAWSFQWPSPEGESLQIMASFGGWHHTPNAQPSITL